MALLSLMLQILAQDLERFAQSYLETHRGEQLQLAGEYAVQLLRTISAASPSRFPSGGGGMHICWEFLLNIVLFTT